MTAPPSLDPAAAPPRPALWRRSWWRVLLVLALLGAAFALTLMWERSLPELSEAPRFDAAQIRAGEIGRAHV